MLRRVRRAMWWLDPALALVEPRLRLTASLSQLTALVAVIEARSFSLAARNLGLAQPSVHRAIAHLESEAGRKLFERSRQGLVPTRATRALGQATRLALAELDQAASDLSELDGQTSRPIVIGALPLSRSVLLPQALVRFRASRPRQQITIIDGAYDELLGGLRRGDIDVMIGAMRDPPPSGDVVQEPWFNDSLCVVSGVGHPLAGRKAVSVDDLAGFPWTVARKGAPARDQFEQRIASRLEQVALIETGSILLMRGLLQDNLHLGCVSSGQAAFEIATGQITALDMDMDWPDRPIGLTRRRDWLATAAQAELLSICRQIVPVSQGA